MQVNFKNYKIKKTKYYVKKSKIFFFFKGPNKSAKKWLFIEQNLKLINFTYYKIFNKILEKTIQKSIFKSIKKTINSVTFLTKPRILKLSKKVLFTDFESLLFNLFTIKLNNKIYSKNQIKNSYCLNYKSIKKLLFQFKLTNLKKSK